MAVVGSVLSVQDGCPAGWPFGQPHPDELTSYCSYEVRQNRNIRVGHCGRILDERRKANIWSDHELSAAVSCGL